MTPTIEQLKKQMAGQIPTYTAKLPTIKDRKKVIDYYKQYPDFKIASDTAHENDFESQSMLVLVKSTRKGARWEVREFQRFEGVVNKENQMTKQKTIENMTHNLHTIRRLTVNQGIKKELVTWLLEETDNNLFKAIGKALAN